MYIYIGILTLSAGWGELQALSSYNTFNNNCFINSFYLISANLMVSLFMAFASYNIIGDTAGKLLIAVRNSRIHPHIIDLLLINFGSGPMSYI